MQVTRAYVSGRPGRGFTMRRGFTMIELIVAVGLMIVLLGVLAFVFRESAGAVEAATEAVTVAQTARNFEAKLARELASAVAYIKEETLGTTGKIVRGFTFDDSPIAYNSEKCIEYVSQAMSDGKLKTWDVKYSYEKYAGKNYGAIRRHKDAPKPGTTDKYELWDHLWEDDDPNIKPETLAAPVRGVRFSAAKDWDPGTDEDQNDRLPAYVRVEVIFLDSWGGKTFEMPMEFYFHVYQGE